MLKLLLSTVPQKLFYNWKYNLNVVKEIKLTDSLSSIQQNCSMEETIHQCRSKEYMEMLKKKCNCVPFSLRISNKVMIQVYSCS